MKVNKLNYSQVLADLLENNQIHISESNKKVKTSTLDILPCVTCPGSTPLCREYCYVRHNLNRTLGYKAYLTVNTNIVKNDLQLFKTQMIAYLTNYNGRFFRLHSSGDYFSQEYVNIWNEIIALFPDIKFLAFTKSYHLDFSKIPSNLSLIYSVMPDTDNGTVPEGIKSYVVFPLNGKFSAKEYQYTESQVNEIKDNSVVCPGSCEDCRLCWHKQSVYFHLHGAVTNTWRRCGSLQYPF